MTPNELTWPPIGAPSVEVTLPADLTLEGKLAYNPQEESRVVPVQTVVRLRRGLNFGTITVPGSFTYKW
jgi:hypothetical protein